jgi:Fic family protein
MLYKAPKLDRSERKVLDDVSAAGKKLRNRTSSPKRWIGLLRRNTFARAIRGSNSIEGYNVTADDAIAAAEGEEPLEAEREAWLAVTGYRNAMTYVLQLANDPFFSYNDGFIRSLHYMMLHYDLPRHPGCWRGGPIYVRDEQRGEIVYEGPATELVPDLIAELIAELNAATQESALVRAAMGHLNLVMIHPFSDGNGRMARCLQTLILSREGILEPQFSSIEEYLGRNTQDYYDVLTTVGKGKWSPQNDARPWIRFCLTAHYRQAETLNRRTIEISRLWDELEELIRRLGLPERMLLALSDAAMGLRVRNATYRSAAELSDNLASRDLALLARKGLLVTSGERRGRQYLAGDELKKIRARTREPKRIVDPVYE